MVRVILLDFAVMRQPRIYKPPCALNKAVIFHLYCIFSVIELESKNKPLCEILTIRNLSNILPHDKKPIVFMRTFTGQIQLMKFRLPLVTNERSLYSRRNDTKSETDIAPTIFVGLPLTLIRSAYNGWYGQQTSKSRTSLARAFIISSKRLRGYISVKISSPTSQKHVRAARETPAK